jgi:hypothetical protein
MLSAYLRVLVTLCAVIYIAGCGSSNQGQSHVKSYPDDGYLGVTSAGPNNPLHPTYHHYEDDFHVMKAVLAQFPDIKDSRIILNGPHADVSIRVKDGLDAAREDGLRSAVQTALRTNMPRYTVRVASQK